jgi:RNA polymerase sigma factor (sigma-70 family)
MEFCHLFDLLGDISNDMITNRNMIAAPDSDAELVSRTLAGDRDAFSRIVSRYQILICSLAYSRIGHLGLSEDVAQETFITAWKHLRLLREPDKLRAWLCGIVRNRIHKNLQREGREPVQVAEPLEAVAESPAREALPSEQTIGREEEAILWRSLERIPELYREPLILFYREHQSIEQVAVELELSGDAVKQRLSRGRKLLQEEVQAFVEDALRRTAPGQAFSGAVLAALPAAPAAVTGAGLAGKGIVAVKSGFLGAWLAPLVGIVGGILAHWLIVRSAPTAAERRVKKVAFISMWVFVLAWCIPGQLALRALSRQLEWSDRTFFAAMAGFWWVYAMIIVTLCVVVFRRVVSIRRRNEETAGPLPVVQPFTWGRRLVVVTGIYLACFTGLIDIAWRTNDPVWVASIAATTVALGMWHFLRLRGKTGLAAMQVTAAHLLLVWGIILLIVNCRLDVWVAARSGISLTEMHRLLPPWVVLLFTLALVLWFGILMAVTKPKRSV